MSQIFPESQKLLEKNASNLNKNQKNKRKYSLNSSSDSESFSTNLKKEIKNLIENDDNLSFSSDCQQEKPLKKEEIDYLFDAKYWKVENNFFYDNEKKFGIKIGIREESNKQSTQGNEDEEIRNDSIESNNNSPLNTFNNNEINENENNLEEKIISNHSSESKEKKDINKNNLKGNNLLLNGPNFINNYNYGNINNYNKFIFPYDQINYIRNQNGSNFFPGPYIQNNFGNYNINYNMPSPNVNKNIIPPTANPSTLAKNSTEKKDINSKNDNNKNNTINKDNSPKLNVNITYYPKLPNTEISKNKSTMNNKVNLNNTPDSNISNELKNSPKQNKNIQEPKKNNKENSSSSNETKNNNNKTKTLTNNINNTNNSINLNSKNSKCEKLFLNLEDIASGKDTRTTIMIRNIPIKYTESILHETFKEFHGKYDCLYMPYDFEKKGNRGYAFINFINPLHILLFYEKFNGKKWAHFESPKICELNMALFQGTNEIQKHAKNYKELKKLCCSKINDKIVIPSKYLSKLKKRFPRMKISENSKKSEFEILSFN